MASNTWLLDSILENRKNKNGQQVPQQETMLESILRKRNEMPEDMTDSQIRQSLAQSMAEAGVSPGPDTINNLMANPVAARELMNQRYRQELPGFEHLQDMNPVQKTIAEFGLNTVGALGRIQGGAGYLAGLGQRVLGAGDTNTFTDTMYRNMESANDVQELSGMLNREGEETPWYRQLAGFAGNIAPNLLVGSMLGGVVGGPAQGAAAAYMAASDAAGEAADVESQLRATGDYDKAARAADLTAGYNMLLGGAQEGLAGPFSGFADDIANPIIRRLTQGTVNALSETGQETGQDVLNEAAQGLANGDVSHGALWQNMANQDIMSKLQSNLEGVGPGSFLMSALFGAGGGNANVQGQQEADNSVIDPQTQAQVTQSPEAALNEAINEVTAPQIGAVREPPVQPNPIQTEGVNPIIAQAIQEAQAAQAAMPAQVRAVREPPQQTAPVQNVPQQPQVVQQTQIPQAQNIVQPQQPAAQQNINATPKDVRTVKKWARDELAKMTSEAEYDEEGNVTNQVDAEYYNTIDTALKKNDYNTLNNLMRSQAAPVYQDEPVPPMPERIIEPAPTVTQAQENIDGRAFGQGRNIDNEYTSALNAGDMAAAQNLVNEQAEKKGYGTTDYRMNHRAPNSQDKDVTVRLDKAMGSDLVPPDYWTRPQNYQSDRREMSGFYAVNKAIKGNSKTLTVYRAVPNTVKESTFRNGDWVTPSLEYARDEGANIPDGFKVIKQEVPISSLWWDGNSINELGYDDTQNYAYKNTKNNRKSLDTITRDETGNIIPISKRFNSRDERTLYQAANEQNMPNRQEAFHGSSKKNIKKLKMSAYGTGDGSSAWGHGIYLAQDPNTANIFTLTNDDFDSDSYDRLLAGERLGGKIYRTSIPDSDNLLDYEKPLNEQPLNVLNKLKPATNLKNNGKMTGLEFYKMLADRLESEKAASEYLSSMGIQGAQYMEAPAFDGMKKTREFIIYDEKAIQIEPDDERTLNQSPQDDSIDSRVGSISNMETPPTDRPVDFDGAEIPKSIHDDALTKMKAINVNADYAEKSAQLYSTGVTNFAKRLGIDSDTFWKGLNVNFTAEKTKDTRASITFGKNGIRINLDPNRADVTSGLHEQGHFFSELIIEAAKTQPDNTILQDMADAVKKEVGWTADQNKLTDAQHEKLAGEYVSYLETGKAPNEQLKTVFERFKGWLMDFYSSFSSDERVPISKEMRQVFDNLMVGDAGFSSIYNEENARTQVGNETQAQAGKKARVISIDARALPVDYKDTRALIKWIKGELQGQSVTVNDDGSKVEFTARGLYDSGKIRGQEQRQTYTALKELVGNAVFDHFESADGKPKHAHIMKQNVYYVGAKMGEGENTRYFSVKIKVDIPKTGQSASYKNHKTEEIALDSVPVPSAETSTRTNPNATSEQSPFPTQSGTLQAEAEAVGSVQGSVSEITLEVLNGNVKPSGIENGTLYQKQATQSVVEGASKVNNVTVMKNDRDESNDLGMFDSWHSPSIVAKLHAKFNPVYTMAKAAMKKQDALRSKLSKKIDNIFGTPGITGRKNDGVLQTDEERQAFGEILLEGDAQNKEFTDAELRELGASDNVVKAYHRIRSLYADMGGMVNAQRAMFGKEAMNMRAGYVPHIFHQWRVIDPNADPEKSIIDTYRTQGEAIARAEELAKESPDKQFKVAPAMEDFGGQAKSDAVTMGDMQYFKFIKNMQDVFALSPEDAKKYSSDVARMGGRSRVFKNAFERKGYEGFSRDMEFAVRRYANLTARYTAMDEFKHRSRNYFERTWGKFDNDHKQLGRYAKNYINDVLGVPNDAEVSMNNLIRQSGINKWLPDTFGDRPGIALSNKINSTVAHLKLGFLNIGSALTQLSQLNMAQAVITPKWVTRGMGEYLHPNKSTLRLYKAAGIENQISMENPSGYSKIHNIRGGLANVSMIGFRVADQATRKITLIGAYRKALSEGMSQQQATQYAIETNEKVNLDYSVADTPDILRRRGPFGNIMLQFKKYPIKMLEQVLPGVGQLKGAEQIRYWTGQILLSGMLGAVPGFNIIQALVKLMFDDEDIELDAKKVVSELPIPDVLKRTILYGALSNIGIDISRRTGFADTLPDPSRGFSDIMGPGASTAIRFIGALPQAFTDGDFRGVIDSLSPGLSNPIKALLGETPDTRSGRVRYEYKGAGERIAKATGLRPMKEALEGDAIRIANYTKQQESKEDIRAINNFIRYIENGDRTSDGYKEARDELRRLRIDPARIQREMRTRRGGTRFDRTIQQNRRNRELTGMMENYAGM